MAGRRIATIVVATAIAIESTTVVLTAVFGAAAAIASIAVVSTASTILSSSSWRSWCPLRWASL